MLASKRDRRLVMDLDSASISPIHTRKSSFSLVDGALPSSTHRRRSSASQIIPIVSQGLFVATANGLKRSPLAPLDPQFSSILYADFEMAHDDAYQSVRKSSITLTNATRPTPYSQRNLHRRPPPPQQRRTSLPALHPSHDPPPPLPHPISPFELAVPRDEDADIYSRLSTFTFGDAQAPKLQPSVPSSSSRVAVVLDGGESVSPLHRADSFDKTPRPSVAHAHAHAHAQTYLQPSVPSTNGWSSPSEDEEERRRTNTRSKMRAIDDGMRRPSLPTNDVRQYGSSSGLTATEKGKGKAVAEGENTHQTAQLSSPSLQNEGEGDLELDTDVDLMSVDDTDGRRKAKNVEMSDRSSTHGDVRMNSDTGSMHGGSEERNRNHDCEQKDKNENDMDEGGDDDDDGIRANRKDSARTWTERTGRRGSLPMDIPYPNNSHSSRASHSYRDDGYSAEFDARAIAHAQLRRPSRSVDDDLHRAALHLQRKASRVSVAAIGAYEVGSGVTPSSEPDMRGLAMAQAIAQAHLDAQAENNFDGANVAGASDSPYQGLDLDYILSVSGSMSGGLAGPRPPEAGKRGSDTWSGRMSVGSSVAAREGRARDPSWAEGWNVNYGVGRRQSTATVNDDTFLRFVKKHDFSYDERKREWTFARERPEGDVAVTKPGQEIWRCLWVGRYRVDRVQGKNTDPTKPPQMRLNIRHLSDPYSKANTRGGPLTFIHKHSRAQAFSIFRGHTLPQRHLKTNSSILLAPKKVQEQFTTTRTTSKLSTHGLLLDDKNTNAAGSGRSGQTASGSGTNSATTSTTSVSGSSRATQSSSTATSKGSSTEYSQQPSSGSGKLKLRIDKSAEAVDRKGKGTMRSPVNNTPSSSQTSVGEFSPPSTDRGVSDTDVSRLRTERSALFNHLRRPIEVDSRSSIAETASLVSEGSQQFSSAVSAWDQSSIASSQQRPARRPQELRQQLVRMPAPARGSVGSLEEQPAIRTSHAEAFATLDPPFIEYLRMHSAHYDGSTDQDPSPSRFKGLRKLFHTQPVRNSPKSSPLSSSSSVATLEGHYTPPWLTMAARSKQEEQERVIKNLNDSFRDVGLLPSFKPSRSRANKKGKRSNENIFDQIPDESLYMLLPMWPGETDPVSAELSDEPMKLDIPLPDRQFLLVYYVANELSKERSDDKKRSRGSQTSSSTSHHTDATSSRENKNTVSLSSFNVLARLVSYKDVNGSGIRVPTDGLSVTGPISDAIREIPQIRFQVDDLALMIAFCANRERGVEVVPEGAEKLGLCLPRTSPDPDSDAPLSSLGRAAVEMAWLGALAVMGFGSVA